VKQRVPETVSILGYDFALAISNVDTAGVPWKTGDDKEYGDTDIFDHKIHLNADQSPKQMHMTRLHEYVHAILQVSGINSLLDEKTEEAIAQAIEHGLAPLIRFK
jgi:Zn-dependent peptidase ImmA (M78 family)